MVLPMLRLTETTRLLPYYRPVPLTSLPLIYHREHLFPYVSYGDTEPTPVMRPFRMIALENDRLRVEVAPELGGRVYSLFDKRLGQEILFSNPVVRPVRILPVWGFISGGIEFNFPIAHSPTSIATVGCRTGRVEDYAYVRVGEREARTGMEWVVELGLAENSAALVQRTAFRNQTHADHPWMSWTIAAVRSTEDTEFVHPPHRVLVHHRRLFESEWPGDGLNWDRNHGEMTALFWKPGSAPQFGTFHHDRGFGLMHLADPAVLPGKKVWTYGHGPHRDWGRATTDGELSYAELESGPLLDQNEKPRFPHGTERRSVEYWVPVHARGDFETASLPTMRLPEWDTPWLGWEHSAWQTEWEQFRAGEGPLPASTVPTGLELEPALRRALGKGQSSAAEPLALWLAFRQRPLEALECLEQSHAPHARRLAGLIRWKGLGQAEQALALLEQGPLDDPIAVCELDELLAAQGAMKSVGSHSDLHRGDEPVSPGQGTRPTACGPGAITGLCLAKRQQLLASAPAHRRMVERQADLALAQGRPEETLRLLSSQPWPREHQRYVRSALWRRAKAVLGEEATGIPAFLGEDELAPYGAYWSSE